MEAEVYKVTSINSDGVEVIAYVLPAARRMYSRMMLEEYGNADAEGLLMADAPDSVQADFKKQTLSE